MIRLKSDSKIDRQYHDYPEREVHWCINLISNSIFLTSTLFSAMPVEYTTLAVPKSLLYGNGAASHSVTIGIPWSFHVNDSTSTVIAATSTIIS